MLQHNALCSLESLVRSSPIQVERSYPDMDTDDVSLVLML